MPLAPGRPVERMTYCVGVKLDEGLIFASDSRTHADVDNYDPVYLPDGRIIFASTRCFHGVPCVGGGNQVANLFLFDPEGDPKGEKIRQITFEQDHDWCPTLLHNGRVMYTRWEYSDSPHYFTRILMHMNPDGTQQAELYGSNSYWPNSTFYARPCPGQCRRPRRARRRSACATSSTPGWRSAASWRRSTTGR